LHGLIADAHSDCGEMTAAVREVEAALATIEGLPFTVDHLELLLVLMMNHQRQLDVPAAAAVAERIERLAEDIGTPESELVAVFARLAILEERARYREALAVAEPYLDRLRTDPVAHRQTTQFVALEALAMGDLGRLRHANAELVALDQQTGIPGWNYRRYLYAFGEALYRGAWDEAQDVLDEFETTAMISENSRLATIGPVVGAVLSAYRGDIDDAERRLQQGRERLEKGLVEPAAGRGVLAVFGAIVALEKGDPAAARALIEPVAAPNPYVLAGVIPPWGLSSLAEARARTGATFAAREAAGLLAAVGPDGTHPAAMARRLEGLAAAADGNLGEARRLLLEARSGFERLRLPFETARAAIEAAEVDDPTEVNELLTSAHRVMSGLGARRYVARATRLLEQSGATVPRHQSNEVGLTERQREVAGLVAKGLSNAEIAERMFVSIRTVTAHLDHIYTKLGIRSRAALAAYITERRHQPIAS
jgi:DNA-binding CsgD family transcriptional regulator